jgi:radical SAM superfamily enzyme YgiQ (UPF0313 family)
MTSTSLPRYEGTLYRPPSEADSLILQATIGCSWNRCTFCAMYRDKRFRVRKLEELEAEIAAVDRDFGPPQKVFLADGDALVAKASFLEALLDRLRATWPELRRVSCYASPQALQLRSVEEMTRLREKGLSLYYLGIESGLDEVLERLDKGVNSAEMTAAALKAHAAGVKLSTMILLGAGGRARSLEHARASAAIVSAIQPRFVSTLVMTPVDGTPLAEQAARGEFSPMSPLELAAELRAFLAALTCRATIFRSNHESNWLALAGTLPKDQEGMIQLLDRILAPTAGDDRRRKP